MNGSESASLTIHRPYVVAVVVVDLSSVATSATETTGIGDGGIAGVGSWWYSEYNVCASFVLSDSTSSFIADTTAVKFVTSIMSSAVVGCDLRAADTVTHLLDTSSVDVLPELYFEALAVRPFDYLLIA